jgi:hypothetical protein
VKKVVKVAKSKSEKPTERKLTPEQLAKLQALLQPERQVDETFDRTDIGSFLLKEHLIAPNPEKDSVKAFIVTSEGRQMLRESR